MLAKLVRKLGIDPAPNWFIRCPGCGREATCESIGMVRIGARSKGKKIRGNCSQCGTKKWMDVFRRPPSEPGA